MSVEANVTIDDHWFLGEDKVLSFHVKDAAGVPVDVSSWALRWSLRKVVGGADVVVKTTGSGITVVGAYDVDPDVNTQRVQVAVDDVDTDDQAERTYVHALKRTDAGNEQVLSHGTVVLRRAAVAS